MRVMEDTSAGLRRRSRRAISASDMAGRWVVGKNSMLVEFKKLISVLPNQVILDICDALEMIAERSPCCSQFIPAIASVFLLPKVCGTCVVGKLESPEHLGTSDRLTARAYHATRLPRPRKSTEAHSARITPLNLGSVIFTGVVYVQ